MVGEPESFIPLPLEIRIGGWHHNVLHCIVMHQTGLVQ